MMLVLKSVMFSGQAPQHWEAPAAMMLAGVKIINGIA
jgi:hypothetical protein